MGHGILLHQQGKGIQPTDCPLECLKWPVDHSSGSFLSSKALMMMTTTAPAPQDHSRSLKWPVGQTFEQGHTDEESYMNASDFHLFCDKENWNGLGQVPPGTDWGSSIFFFYCFSDPFQS